MLLVVLTGMGNDGLRGAREVAPPWRPDPRRVRGQLHRVRDAARDRRGRAGRRRARPGPAWRRRSRARQGMSDRETRAFQRTAIARPRGHDAAAVRAEERPGRRRRLHRVLRRTAQALRDRPGAVQAAADGAAPALVLRAPGHLEARPTALDRVLRPTRQLLEELLDRVTINVSQLWRHPDQWARLEGGLLRSWPAAARVRAWSAGCSYGAEAYTLAAVCSQAIPGVPVRIVGTDIDQRMVARAKAAHSASRTRAAPPTRRCSGGSSAPTRAGRPSSRCGR